MASWALDIDELVRGVMADMGLAPRAGATPLEPQSTDAPLNQTPQQLAPTPPPSAEPPRKDDELRVESRVVTLAALRDRLGRVRRVVVPPGAVITPAVRDELARRQIALDVASSTNGQPQGKSPATRQLIVTTHRAAIDAASLAAIARGRPIDVVERGCDCLIRETDELARELAAGGRAALVLTHFAPAALCLANRQPALRAVWGFDAARIAGDVAAVGANVLVVDPRGTTAHQRRQFLTTFLDSANSPCPAALKGRLGEG